MVVENSECDVALFMGLLRLKIDKAFYPCA
jgi:hypothetical protein